MAPRVCVHRLRRYCRFRSHSFDFDAEDFFAGLAIAGDAINAPAAKATFKN
jgi:hypothetical protein